MENRRYRTEIAFHLRDRRAHGLRVRHIRAHIAGTHPGGGEAREIVREFLVRFRIASSDERELHAGFAGERQRALRRDALAAAGDEQNVFRADGTLRFDLRRRETRASFNRGSNRRPSPVK